MAFLYKRNRSPFWWVRWITPEGDKRQESTGFRHGVPAETRKAKEICARKELEELSRPAPSDHAWKSWVPGFIKIRYASSPSTLNRVTGIWSTLDTYLDEIDIKSPVSLRREHCLGYMSWRQDAGHMNKRAGGGKSTSHNTALLELRILSVIMTEAVHRGIVPHSPLWRLGIKKTPPKEKQELTGAHVAAIRQEIQRVRENDPELGHYLATSFEIALGQGWRLHETWLDLEQVNLDALTVYRIQKGGRTIASPLNPSLVPLFQRLRSEGRTHTYPKQKLPSLEWFKLFDRLREKDRSFDRVSFHSTRVTVISRLLNAGVGQPSVMKMVGHASATINRLYHRLPAEQAAQIFRVLDEEPKRVKRPETPGESSGTGRSG